MFNYLSQLKKHLAFYSLSYWLLGIGYIFLTYFFVYTCKSIQLSIATVDITGIVQQYVQSQAKLNLPANQLQQRINTFGHQLEMVLQDVVNTKHLILMPQEAVIAGSIDLTPLIEKRLQELQDADNASKH
jgi:hypothetical protein